MNAYGATKWKRDMRRSSSGVAAPLIAVALVAAVAGGVVVGWGVSAVVKPAPRPVDEIAKISVIIDYQPGSSQYLGSSPANGCAYENCPIALNASAGVVTLNLALLSDLAYGNFTSHSAVVSSVYSSPTGIAAYTGSPLVLSSGSLVWAGVVCTLPSDSASYSVTVVVTAT